MDSGRLHYVTRRYPQLQGLRLLPLAALFLVSAAWRAGLVPLPGSDRPLVAGRWFVAGLAAAIAASYPLRAARDAGRFGRVSQRATDSQLPPLAVAVACVALALSVQEEAGLPFSLPAAVVALMLAAAGVAHYPLRRHYLGAAAVFAALALLRPLGVPAEAVSVLFDAAIAVALVIAGVGDHRLLATTLHEVHAGA